LTKQDFICIILEEIGKSNECVASNKEVVRMVDILIQLVILTFTGLVSVTIITLALIIVLVHILSK